MPVPKVVAYITREKDGKRELLVNIHKDFPEVGIQVPSGTVEPGELVEDALYREIQEESGLKKTDVLIQKKLASYTYHFILKQQTHERHVYHLIAASDLPDVWEIEDQHAEGEAVTLCYFWVPLNEVNLTVGLSDYLFLIAN